MSGFMKNLKDAKAKISDKIKEKQNNASSPAPSSATGSGTPGASGTPGGKVTLDNASRDDLVAMVMKQSTQLKILKQSYDELHEAAQSHEQRASRLAGKRDALKQQVADLTSQLEAASKEADVAKHQAAETATANEDAKVKMNERMQKAVTIIKRYEEEKAALQQQLAVANAQSESSASAKGELAELREQMQGKVSKLQKDLSTAIADARSKQNECDTLTKSITELRGELAANKSEAGQFKAQIAKAEGQLREREKELVAARQSANKELDAATERSRAQTEADRDALNKAIENARVWEAKASEWESRYKSAVESAATDLERVKQELRDNEGASKDKQSDLQSRIDSLVTETEQLTKDVKTHEAQARVDADTITTLKAHVSRAEEECREAKSLQEAAKAGGEAHTQALESQLGKAREDFEKERSGLEERLTQLSEKLRTADSEVTQVEADKRKGEQQHEQALSDVKESHQSELAAVKAKLQEESSAHLKRAEDLAHQLQMLSTEQSGLTNERDAVKETVSSLEQSLATARKELQETHAELESAKRKWSELEDGHAILSKQLEAASAAHKQAEEESEKKISELSQKLDEQIAAAGESSSSRESELVEATAKIEALEEQLKACEADLESAQSAKQESESALTQERSATNERLGKAKTMVLNLKKEVETLQGQVKTHESTLEARDIEVTASKERLREKSSECEALAVQLEDAKKEVSSLQSDRDAASLRADEQQHRAESAEASIAQLQSSQGEQVAQLSEDNTQLRGEVTAMEEKLREAAALEVTWRKTYKEKDAALDASKEELQEAQYQHKIALRDVKKQLKASEVRADTGESEVARLQAELDAATTKASALSTEVEATVETRAEAQAALEAAKSNTNKLQAQVEQLNAFLDERDADHEATTTQLREQLADARGQVTAKAKEAAEASAALTAAKASLAAAERSAADESARTESANTEVAQLQAQLESLRAEHASAQAATEDEAAKKIQELEQAHIDALAEKDGELESLAAEKSALLDKRAELNEQLETQATQHEESIAELKVEAERGNDGRLERLQMQMEQMREEHDEELGELEDQIKAAKVETEDALAKVGEVEATAAQAKKKADAEIAMLSGDLREARAELQAGRARTMSQVTVDTDLPPSTPSAYEEDRRAPAALESPTPAPTMSQPVPNEDVGANAMSTPSAAPSSYNDISDSYGALDPPSARARTNGLVGDTTHGGGGDDDARFEKLQLAFEARLQQCEEMHQMQAQVLKDEIRELEKAGKRAKALDTQYLKNVWLKYVETEHLGPADEHEMLVPVISDILQTTRDENARLDKAKEDAQWKIMSYLSPMSKPKP